MTQQEVERLWEAHVRVALVDEDVEATMVADPSCPRSEVAVRDQLNQS